MVGFEGFGNSKKSDSDSNKNKGLSNDVINLDKYVLILPKSHFYCTIINFKINFVDFVTLVLILTNKYA